jgi:hypothetical protein
MSDIELTDEIFDELTELAAAMREDTIDDMGVARLDQLLCECPGAVDVYVALGLLTSDLRDAHGVEMSALPAPADPPPRRFPHWMIAAAAAIALIAGIALLQPSTPNPPLRGAVVATATESFDVTFSYGGPDGSPIASGDGVHQGQYSMTAGILELTYANGAVVIVEGPAEFALESDMLLRLTTGNISARIPETATGFTVETDAAKVIDLGTEFSVRATATSSEVHVFEGEVVVETNSQEEPLHLFKDQASRIDTTSRTPTGIDSRPNDFLRVLDEPQHVYPRQVAKLNPVAYYRMRPSETNVLDDFANGSEYPGEYVRGKSQKAGWSPGRFGASLRCRGDAARRYAVVDEFPISPDRTFSVVAWVMADSRPRWATIAKHWGDTESGLFHFGLYRNTGELEGHIRDDAGNNITVKGSEPFPLGTWQHVALVADGEHLHLYQNGEEIATAAYSSIAIDPLVEKLGIGAKLAVGESRDRAFWDGRIDEVAIFHHALDADQIKALHAIHPAE